MLLLAHNAMPLQLGMDALIDLRTGAVVGRDDQRVLRRLRVLPRDGVNPLLAAPELMHPALAVQVFIAAPTSPRASCSTTCRNSGSFWRTI